MGTKLSGNCFGGDHCGEFYIYIYIYIYTYYIYVYIYIYICIYIYIYDKNYWSKGVGATMKIILSIENELLKKLQETPITISV